MYTTRPIDRLALSMVRGEVLHDDEESGKTNGKQESKTYHQVILLDPVS